MAGLPSRGVLEHCQLIEVLWRQSQLGKVSY